MAKFYDGQPVVCVWDESRWVFLHRRPSWMPRRGERYVVDQTLRFEGFLDGCARVELRGYGTLWNENGFEPITENQVRALEAIATDVPDEVRRELEEA